MRFILVLFLLISLPVNATDIAREKRWIEQTVDSIFDGEAVFLDADGHQFLSIYTEAETVSTNGMIVIHGTGFHPNWDQVVRPVRVKMTEHGWNTLSIQMPVLDKDAAYEDYVALYPEVPARIQAAKDYLTEQGVNYVVIVAHSQGATMASYYLAHNDHNIAALVAIGMSAQHIEPHINSAKSLKNIDIPVLDIYGSKDFPSVLATSEQRSIGAAHNQKYTQSVIANAYHFFDDHEAQLLEALRNWLEELL